MFVHRAAALIVMFMVTLLAACAGAVPWNPQNYAGLAAYEIEPIVTETGEVACCKVWIRDGKESQAIRVRVDKKIDGSLVVEFEAADRRAFAAFASRAEVEQFVAEQLGDSVSAETLQRLIDGLMGGGG